MRTIDVPQSPAEYRVTRGKHGAIHNIPIPRTLPLLYRADKDIVDLVLSRDFGAMHAAKRTWKYLRKGLEAAYEFERQAWAANFEQFSPVGHNIDFKGDQPFLLVNAAGVGHLVEGMFQISKQTNPGAHGYPIDHVVKYLISSSHSPSKVRSLVTSSWLTSSASAIYDHLSG